MVRNLKTVKTNSQALVLGIAIASISLFSIPASAQVVVLQPATSRQCADELEEVRRAEQAYDLQQERLASAMDKLTRLEERARQVESLCQGDQECEDENYLSDTESAIAGVRKVISNIEEAINRRFEDLLDADAELAECLRGASTSAAGTGGSSR